MSDLRWPQIVTAAGGLAVAVALGWWAVVFQRVVDGGYMTYVQAAPCALSTTDLCSLAQALCTSDHWLGIKRYSEGLIWAGFALIILGTLLPFVRRPAERRSARAPSVKKIISLSNESCILFRSSSGRAIMSERVPPIVGLTGATSADRRLTAAVQTVLAAADALPGGVALLDYCSFDTGIRSARFRSQVEGSARDALAALESARALVLGVPVERGSVPGLFKHLLDLADPEPLRHKPTLIVVHGHPGDDENSVRQQVEFLCGAFGLDPIHEPIVVARRHFTTDGQLLPDAAKWLARAGRTLALTSSARVDRPVDVEPAVTGLH